MKESLPSEDLLLFLAVARGGGLSPAARETGSSPATLGRRMARLEHWAGCPLFVRWATGYALTEAGRELLVHARGLEAARADAARWREGRSARETVRITAGTWMTRFLASRIAAIARPGDGFRPLLASDNARADIAHRHAAIGLRNRRPEEAWLAGRKVAVIAFAPYRAAATEDGASGERWIGLEPEVAATPSARWVAEHHGRDLAVAVSDPRTLLDLALAGAGTAVLPCFVGDAEQGLVRAGPEIDALGHDQWLVVHHEERHRPAVRRLADRIAGVIAADLAG
ncbi:MAG: LysR family transcriptional regulator [Azospirillaceae bacterium]